MKVFVIILLVSILAIGAYFSYTYFALGRSTVVHEELAPSSQQESPISQSPVAYKVEAVAEKLYVPWSLVFTSPSRILLTERNGLIRIIENNTLKPELILQIKNVYAEGEAGLMGMTLHPDYEKNKYVYVAYAYRVNGGLKIRVERYIDQKTSLKDDKLIIDYIPAANVHAGTRIKFGPDKKLYISTGDAAEKSRAQNIQDLNGKILRVNDDGSFPSDNPFPNSPVWTYGHRNPQGFAWNLETGDMWETEHGPTVFDGPAGGDEVNLLVKGKNYGWPQAHHEIHIDGMEDPKLIFTPAVAPADAIVYSGKMFPQFKNNFLFAALKGEGIYRVEFSEANPQMIARYEKMTDITAGRIREITEAPDGSIYFTTSNVDGRGKPQEGDDKVYRIVKQ